MAVACAPSRRLTSSAIRSKFTPTVAHGTPTFSSGLHPRAAAGPDPTRLARSSFGPSRVFRGERGASRSALRPPGRSSSMCGPGSGALPRSWRSPRERSGGAACGRGGVVQLAAASGRIMACIEEEPRGRGRPSRSASGAFRMPAGNPPVREPAPPGRAWLRPNPAGSSKPPSARRAIRYRPHAHRRCRRSGSRLRLFGCWRCKLRWPRWLRNRRAALGVAHAEGGIAPFGRGFRDPPRASRPTFARPLLQGQSQIPGGRGLVRIGTRGRARNMRAPLPDRPSPDEPRPD